MSPQVERDSKIVGRPLAELLPRTSKYWFQQSHLLRLNALLLIPLLSSSVNGYDGSLMNGLQTLPQWRGYFGNPSGGLLGLVNAAQSIGGALGLPLVSLASDRYGRKPVLISGLALVCAAAAIQAASVSYAMFVVARVLVGLGGMLVVQPSPMLIAELAYPTHRGKYTSTFGVVYALGSILASWTTFGTQVHNSSMAWRLPSALQAGFPLLQLAFIWLVPESPRWLVAQGRTDEAVAILARYHDPDTPGSPLVERELAEIAQTIQRDRIAANTGWAALVSTPGNRRRTFVAVCTGLFAQWNGVAVISYYLVLVLNNIGVTDTFSQTLINGLLQVFNFGSALTGALLVDRVGRRTLFLWSGVGMLVSYVVWTACAALNTQRGDTSAGIVVIVCLFAYFFHYDIAWSPLLFTYPTEILPYALRSKGLALDMTVMYASLVVSSFANPIGMQDLGWRYYIVFCALLAVFLLVTYLVFPETKGHTLEDIARIFDGDAGGVSVGAEDMSNGDESKTRATDDLKRI